MQPPEQISGCLPEGFNLDSMLTPKQFCRWVQKSADWFAAHRRALPGVIAHTRQAVLVHPRTYLEKSRS